MKFTFKRKYTSVFMIFLILLGIAITFYFVGPKFIAREQEFFNQVLWVSIIDAFLITLFIFGLYRVNYYLYHDKIEIHKSLHKTISLDYTQIKEIVEYPNDTIFLMFGTRTSFKIFYQKGNKLKKYRVRVENHKLLKLVIENEKKIHITKNK